MEYEEYLEQGETLASEGLIEEALSRFEQALESAPGNPEVIEAVGRALLNLGRLEEAEASFLDALEIDPEWVAPRMGLALGALGRGGPVKSGDPLARPHRPAPPAGGGSRWWPSGGTSRSRSCTTWSGPSRPSPATRRPTSSSGATTATWASRRWRRQPSSAGPAATPRAPARQ